MKKHCNVRMNLWLVRFSEKGQNVLFTVCFIENLRKYIFRKSTKFFILHLYNHQNFLRGNKLEHALRTQKPLQWLVSRCSAMTRRPIALESQSRPQKMWIFVHILFQKTGKLQIQIFRRLQLRHRNLLVTSHCYKICQNRIYLLF